MPYLAGMHRRRFAVACALACASASGGCGHDWSAADATSEAFDVADAAEVEDFAADGVSDDDVVAEADGGGTDVPWEADAEADGDARPDVPPCDPTLESCTEGRLRRCAPDGSGWEDVVCAFGCAPDELRCLRLAPANVTDDTLLDRGTTPFDLDAGAQAVFDTDTGEIVVYGAAGAEVWVVRPPGTGTLAGIPFAVEDQGTDAAALGIWVFSRLTVPREATVHARGSNAMVLLVGSDAAIDGVIDVGGVPDEFGGGRGPAAGAGGAAEAAGQGSGGGRPGHGLGWIPGTGGGGAGCGGRGGRGGDGGLETGGAGGPTWGNPELRPLVGGSGGGGGGDDDGGGALQISAGGRLVIAAGGGITAGGRGGQGGQGLRGGGGGGGSGGAVLLEAAEIALRGGVACNGGGGGAGSPGAGEPGADGADGTLAAAPGAAGGAARGSGTSGGAGSDALTVDGASGTDGSPLTPAGGAGGGGGGAGRIRLQGPAIVVDGFLSPAETTGLATRGPCATR